MTLNKFMDVITPWIPFATSMIVLFFTLYSNYKIRKNNQLHEKSINESNQLHQKNINKSNQNHQEYIASIKANLDEKFYIFKKVHDREFETKVELWNTLADIEEIIEGLWENNGDDRQIRAKEAWNNAKKQLRKAEIFIPKTLVEDIEGMLRVFKIYIDGKGRLNDNSFRDYHDDVVETNRLNRQSFKNLQISLKEVIISGDIY